jgi:hypothetical protein
MQVSQVIIMKNEYVQSALPLYHSKPQQSEKVADLIGNPIGLTDYSIYRGVLVFWDNDYDARVLTFIDNNEMLIPKMLAVSERKAYLTVLWLGKIPNLPKVLTGTNEFFPNMVEIAGDSWQVESYKTTSHIWLTILKNYMKQVPKTE